MGFQEAVIVGDLIAYDVCIECLVCAWVFDF